MPHANNPNIQCQVLTRRSKKTVCSMKRETLESVPLFPYRTSPAGLEAHPQWKSCQLRRLGMRRLQS